MVTHSHGLQHRRSRNFTSKGRLTIRQQLKAFPIGALVRISPNPSYKTGRPHLRFKGKAGKVEQILGKNNYVLKFNDGGKSKAIIVSNVHLQEVV